MKRTKVLLFAICFAANDSTASSVPKVEFAGLLRTADGMSMFVLTDPARGVASEWLELGQSFQDFTLVSFAKETDVLVVSKDEVPYGLPLKEGKVVHAGSQAGAANVTFTVILLEDGTVFASGKTIPLKSLSTHIQDMTWKAPSTRMAFSVMVQPGRDAARMDLLKQQLLSALPVSSSVVKLQGMPPPSEQK